MSTNNWGVPKGELYSTIGRAVNDESQAVLATIVDVEGNAYRRPGAKMVIEQSGEGIGNISAGCIEDEVLKLAADVARTGDPIVETFDLMDDDTWGLGVGCNGIIDVLLEPIDSSFEPVTDAYNGEDDVEVVTVLETNHDDIERGDRVIICPGEPPYVQGNLPDSLVEDATETALELSAGGASKSLTLSLSNEPVTVFVDGITSLPELVILGSGRDIGPLVDLAKQNDFRVSVIGFRGGIDLDTRFPTADETTTTSPANLSTEWEFDEETYAVVMTHNFIDDRIAVVELLKTDCQYVGLMGPHDRFEEMVGALDDQERTIIDENLDQVYSPVGLDLGGGSPLQIATSIIGEVLAIHNDRTPGHLAARDGPVHDRIEL